MTTLTISTQARKTALIQAAQYMSEQLTTDLDCQARDLRVCSDRSFDSALNDIKVIRQQLKFANDFAKATAEVPVGISVYLDESEANTLVTGLYGLLDQELECDGDNLSEIVSLSNLNKIVNESGQGYHLNESHFAEMVTQVRESLDGNSAVQDLIDELEVE